MNAMERKEEEGPVGKGVAVVEVPPHATFKLYLADRPAPTGHVPGAEMVLDVLITLDHPVHKVWPIFKEFDLWMSRFGYFWGEVPANNENKFVSLGNKPGANNLKYGIGSRTVYIVRKVIPEHLIYFDSLPAPIPDKEGSWTGHNLISLYEEGGQTKIMFFMEHTFYSEWASIEELRSVAKELLDAGRSIWRDYFIPDLVSAIEGRSSKST